MIVTEEGRKRDSTGETKREIVFAILHNQLRNQKGLTKKQTAMLVEKMTEKDRGGLRRKVALLLGEKSPFKGFIQTKTVDSGTIRKRTYYKINPKNLKDVAKLYNFMLPSERFVRAEEFKDLIESLLGEYIDDVVDYLYLWGPFESPYNIPDKLLVKYADSESFDFYPKRSKSAGPELMKSAGKDFDVFVNLYRLVIQNLDGFFRLVEKFEEFRDEILTKVNHQGISTDKIHEGKLNLGNNQPIRYSIIYLQSVSSENSLMAGDILWFYNAWTNSWLEGREVKGIISLRVTPEESEKTGHDIPGKNTTTSELQERVESSKTLYEREKIDERELKNLKSKYNMERDGTWTINIKNPYDLVSGKFEMIKAPRQYAPMTDTYTFNLDIKYFPDDQYYRINFIKIKREELSRSREELLKYAEKFVKKFNGEQTDDRFIKWTWEEKTFKQQKR